MKKYECYKVEEKVSQKGNPYKKLVLQADGAQYPIKNVTMFHTHPLFNEIQAGQAYDLEINEEDSGTPNPKAPGKNYINRTVVNTETDTPAPQPSKDFTVTNTEIKNILNFKVIPMLEKITEYMETQQGLNPKAIDAAVNGVGEEDSPF